MYFATSPINEMLQIWLQQRFRLAMIWYCILWFLLTSFVFIVGGFFKIWFLSILKYAAFFCFFFCILFHSRCYFWMQVPPDAVEPLFKQIVNQFVHDRSRPEVFISIFLSFDIVLRTFYYDRSTQLWLADEFGWYV